MNRLGRLDTEALIQECREGYDASKNKQRVRELQLTLELRNKELHLLTSQIAECKQETSAKILTLEESINKLQRQNADLRVASIKSKRAENERADQRIKAIRAECQRLLQDQQENNLKAYQALEAKFNEQLKRNEDKTSQLSQLNKDENATLKALKEQKYSSIEAYVKNLESEKSQLLLSKRDAQKRLESMKQAYDKMKGQFEISLIDKEDNITKLKGEVQGLKLKEKFLSEKLQSQSHSLSQLRINSKYDQDQLAAANQKLLKEKQQLTDLLQSKTEEILQLIQLGTKSISEQFIIPPIQNCEHIGLINQLERSLDLKETELKELRLIVQEWTEKIGFDQPISSRFDKLLSTAAKTQKNKINQFNALKQKNRSMNSSRRLK